jgi:hypothetical protein
VRSLVLILTLFLSTLSAAAQSDTDIEVMQARSLYVAGDYAAAAAVLRPHAEAGHPRAQTMLGFLAEKGLGMPADPAAGLALYRLAAAQGFATAIYNVASMTEGGRGGLTADPVAARALYWQAAAQDYAPALNALANMLLDGTGGTADPATALSLYERAAGLGDAQASATLAWMLATGTNVAADLPRARALYEIAAAHRIDWAERDYAEMLEFGEGGPVDLALAHVYYTRAAKQGNIAAGVDLAELTFHNPEVFPDAVAGLAWCFWAEAQPPAPDGSKYEGDCVEPAAALTPAEVEAARALAATL